MLNYCGVAFDNRCSSQLFLTHLSTYKSHLYLVEAYQSQRCHTVFRHRPVPMCRPCIDKLYRMQKFDIYILTGFTCAALVLRYIHTSNNQIHCTRMDKLENQYGTFLGDSNTYSFLGLHYSIKLMVPFLLISLRWFDKSDSTQAYCSLE